MARPAELPAAVDIIDGRANIGSLLFRDGFCVELDLSVVGLCDHLERFLAGVEVQEVELLALLQLHGEHVSADQLVDLLFYRTVTQFEGAVALPNNFYDIVSGLLGGAYHQLAYDCVRNDSRIDSAVLLRQEVHANAVYAVTVGVHYKFFGAIAMHFIVQNALLLHEALLRLGGLQLGDMLRDVDAELRYLLFSSGKNAEKQDLVFAG